MAESADPLEAFLEESSWSRALAKWLPAATLEQFYSVDELLDWLAEDVAEIDERVSGQINEILHHRRFQQLEASWRGLEYLVKQADVDEDGRIKVKALNVSWRELAKDAERATEFDMSQLFRKVYTEQFDMPGGEAFGVLIGDYEIHNGPSAEHPEDDIEVLESIAGIAAAAFSPFVASMHPSFFGLESFAQFERPMNLTRILDQPEYVRWNALRRQEDARFIGLTLPRILLRLPYEDDGTREEPFRFREQVEGPSPYPENYLWGTAGYAFAGILIRAFRDYGWLAAIRGFERGREGGGLVSGLPVHSLPTEKAGVALQGSTDLVIHDRLEKELSDLGFIPLCPCKDTPYSVFFGNQSVQRPVQHDEFDARMNAQISAMLQYILCASRFAHFLKIFVRDKIASFADSNRLQRLLHREIFRYVTPAEDASDADKARFPLRDAQIAIRERLDLPGAYSCEIHLLPHYQLDAVQATVTLRTELKSPANA